MGECGSLHQNLAPKHIVFRYYTPFLAPCYSYLAIRLKTAASCIALVDNWIPHEQRQWDRWLTQKIKKTFTRIHNTLRRGCERNEKRRSGKYI